jgi:hypothetical protein
MPSTMVIGSRYDDTFNTVSTYRISCCFIYYIWPLDADSRLLQKSIIRLPLNAVGVKKKSLEGNLNKVMLGEVTLSKQ